MMLTVYCDVGLTCAFDGCRYTWSQYGLIVSVHAHALIYLNFFHILLCSLLQRLSFCTLFFLGGVDEVAEVRQVLC